MLEIFILSIVQSLSEFLPISSSLHILIFSKIFNFDSFFSSKIFLISIHLGSLFAIIFYFFEDIKNIIKDFLKLFFNKKAFFNKKNLFLILASSTFPLIFFAFIFKDIAERIFSNIITTSFIFLQI